MRNIIAALLSLVLLCVPLGGQGEGLEIDLSPTAAPEAAESPVPELSPMSVAPLLAAGIRSVFEEGSVATLLEGLPEDMRPRNIYA